MTSRALTIGKLARAAGVIIETIRYYQRIGLIEQPQKPAYGFRHYSQDTVDRVRFIKRAQQLGFSLDEIRELLALDAGHCDDARRLADQRPRHFTMLVFYRGLHCPICKTYLRDLNGKIPEFTARGVEAIALSCDGGERAERTKQEWGLDRPRIGYGLTIPKAREWGLFISRGIKEGEPAEFSEPGLFLVRPDGTLYASAVNSMPFSRPSFADVLNAVDFVTRNDYPARGEA